MRGVLREGSPVASKYEFIETMRLDTAEFPFSRAPTARSTSPARARAMPLPRQASTTARESRVAMRCALGYLKSMGWANPRRRQRHRAAGQCAGFCL
jgi:hypothetical protein